VSWVLADRSRPAQALEVDVQGEIASAISMAHDSNWSLPYLEEQIKQHKGDVNAIFHEVCQPCYQKCIPWGMQKMKGCCIMLL